MRRVKLKLLGIYPKGASQILRAMENKSLLHCQISWVHSTLYYFNGAYIWHYNTNEERLKGEDINLGVSAICIIVSSLDYLAPLWVPVAVCVALNKGNDYVNIIMRPSSYLYVINLCNYKVPLRKLFIMCVTLNYY